MSWVYLFFGAVGLITLALGVREIRRGVDVLECLLDILEEKTKKE